MKNLFTYPLDAATNYIDPDYVGDANSGMTKRVNELLDGSYDNWLGLDPVSDLGTSLNKAEKHMSKFVNYFDNDTVAPNLSIRDFWEKPLIQFSKTLTADPTSILAADTGAPATITFSVDHEFATGDMIRLTDFNGSWATETSPTRDYYASVLSSTTLQVAGNPNGTDLVSFLPIQTIDSNGQAISNETQPVRIEFLTSFDYPDGMEVTINTVEFNGQDMVGNNYYVKEVASPIYDLYQDEALTNPLTIVDLLPLVAVTTGATVLTQRSNPALFTFPAPLDTTTKFAYTETELSRAGTSTTASNFPNFVLTNYVWWKPTANPLQYEAYKDEALTDAYDFSTATLDVFGDIVGPQSESYQNNDPFRFTFEAPYWIGGQSEDEPITLSQLGPNLAQLEASNPFYLTVDTQGGFQSDQRGQLYYDLAKTQPVTRDSLDPNLFTYSETQSLSDTSYELQLTGAFSSFALYTKTGLTGFVDPNTKLYMNYPAVYTDVAMTTPVVMTVPFDIGRFEFIDPATLDVNAEVKIDLGTVTPANTTNIKIVGYNAGNAGYNSFNNVELAVTPVAGRLGWYNITGYSANDLALAGDFDFGPAVYLFDTNNAIDWTVTRSDTSDYACYSTVEVTDAGGLVTFVLANTWYYVRYRSLNEFDVFLDAAFTIRPAQSWTGETPTTPYAFRPELQFQNTQVTATRGPVAGETLEAYPYTDQYDTVYNTVVRNYDTSIAQDWIPATTGDINLTFGLTPTDATTGTVSISPNEPVPYKIDGISLTLPGNEVYSYQDTNNTTVYAAELDQSGYWLSGYGTKTALQAGEIDAVFWPPTVDANGRIDGAPTIVSPGRYIDQVAMLYEVVSPADTYVPPVPTPAELADVWDTDDEWTTTGEDDRKVWPTVVTPMSASITLNTPSTVNRSQNGLKYTRASGFTKWTLEVEYPPMRAEQFREFHGIAQAANGQATPFLFKLRNAEDTSILWADFGKAGTTDAPMLLEAIEQGDTTMLLAGFAGFETDAFRTGEVFIDGANDNGALHTVVNTVDANAFGEAKIRTAMPVKQDQGVATTYNKDPEWAVVTLNSDDFSYSVDTAGFYHMNVAFDLDGWK